MKIHEYQAKAILREFAVPVPRGEVASTPAEARAIAERLGGRVVVKADGLAAGKGVVICRTEKEAVETLDAMMRSKIFGEAGDRVVIEEFMEGEEASFLAFTDGDTVLPLESCQDHKALLDGDQGPNTGGMGAYSPAPVVTAEVRGKIMDQIMIPAVNALKEEGRKYKGILYAGLMIKDGEPSVLEFNCRFGDPEAQPLMVRMKSDIVPLINAVIEERLSGQVIDWKDESSVCVVMASRGYPGDYKKGIEIKGIKNLEVIDGVFVFHSGTAFENGKIVTDGGRVLGVTALGKTITEAINLVYKAVEKIDCEALYYRTDIGKKALKHL